MAAFRHQTILIKEGKCSKEMRVWKAQLILLEHKWLGRRDLQQRHPYAKSVVVRSRMGPRFKK
jgi:hypothetical protein